MTLDPALWKCEPAYGAAGGPDRVVLTEEGLARAFSKGAQVRWGPAAEALITLSSLGGVALLVKHQGSKIVLTPLGLKYDQTIWSYLRGLGYVGSSKDGVLLTTAGQLAVRNGFAERESLLRRCQEAAAQR